MPRLATLALGGIIAVTLAFAAAASAPLRVALGEPASAETAAFLLALQRAEEEGLPLEVMVLDGEGAVFAAVRSGAADVGLGTPYAEIAATNAPIRVVFQLTRLSFFPVATNEYESLKDLDGVTIMLHAPGSGTDAIATAIENRVGIRFGARTYLEGSENRAVAMLVGSARATIVDLENRNAILDMGGEDFRGLPMFDIEASDEVLFVGVDALEARQEQLEALLHAVDVTWHDLTENPAVVANELREPTLAGSLPKDVRDTLPTWMAQAVEAGIFPRDPGQIRASAQADLDWYLSNVAETTGPADISQFWDFGPIEAVHAEH